MSSLVDPSVETTSRVFTQGYVWKNFLTTPRKGANKANRPVLQTVKLQYFFNRLDRGTLKGHLTGRHSDNQITGFKENLSLALWKRKKKGKKGEPLKHDYTIVNVTD